MNIEILLTEAEIAQEFTESIEARDLPEKFFYWFPLSVRTWQELARDDGYNSLRHTWNEISRRAGDLFSHFDKVAPVVSFGAGDGSKDRMMIEALKSAGYQVKYFPVDASQALLEIACSWAEDDDIEVLGMKADISSPVHLVLASDASESPKILLMSGNTLGGFDPLEQIRHVAACMHPKDRLVIDGEIYSDEAVRAFERPVLRRFAFAPLASIGIAEEDGEMRFEHRQDERRKGGLHMMTKRFHAHRDLRLSVSGQEIMMERGERIFMNFRYLYTPEAFRWLLTEHGGLKLIDESISEDGRFITAVCGK